MKRGEGVVDVVGRDKLAATPSKWLPGVYCDVLHRDEGDTHPRLHFQRRNKRRRHERHPSHADRMCTPFFFFFLFSPSCSGQHFLPSDVPGAFFVPLVLDFLTRNSSRRPSAVFPPVSAPFSSARFLTSLLLRYSNVNKFSVPF